MRVYRDSEVAFFSSKTDTRAVNKVQLKVTFSSLRTLCHYAVVLLHSVHRVLIEEFCSYPMIGTFVVCLYQKVGLVL